LIFVFHGTIEGLKNMRESKGSNDALRQSSDTRGKHGTDIGVCPEKKVDFRIRKPGGYDAFNTLHQFWHYSPAGESLVDSGEGNFPSQACSTRP
jgi:hypothetical protein